MTAIHSNREHDHRPELAESAENSRLATPLSVRANPNDTPSWAWATTNPNYDWMDFHVLAGNIL
jgi:hypothetical protein